MWARLREWYDMHTILFGHRTVTTVSLWAGSAASHSRELIGYLRQQQVTTVKEADYSERQVTETVRSEGQREQLIALLMRCVSH